MQIRPFRRCLQILCEQRNEPWTSCLFKRWKKSCIEWIRSEKWRERTVIFLREKYNQHSTGWSGTLRQMRPCVFFHFAFDSKMILHCFRRGYVGYFTRIIEYAMYIIVRPNAIRVSIWHTVCVTHKNPTIMIIFTINCGMIQDYVLQR